MTTSDPLDFSQQESDFTEKAKADEHDAKVEIDEIKWVMSNKRGRRFIYRLLARAGIWRVSFSNDIAVMAFNEGRRNEGLIVLAQITEHCQDRYFEMLNENGKQQ